MTAPRVAILGAGWAGMAAAVELADRGADVTVFEAARTLGGRARRVVLDGVPLDNGSHLLLGAYRDTLAAITRVADGATLFRRAPLRLESASGFRLACPALPAPLHLLAGLLTARGLTVRDRLAAVRLMTDARRRGFRLAASTTVTEHLDRLRQPAGIRDALWHPLCLAALNTPPDLADAQVLLNVLRDGLARERADADLVFPAVDLSAMFPEPAARFVEQRGGRVLPGNAVRAISQAGSGFVVHAASGDHDCDHVVCAVDPARAPALLAALPALADTVAAIERMAHAPIVSLYLDYGPDIALAGPMVGIDRGPAEWVFDRGALCGQRGWMGAVISAADRWMGVPHATLVDDVQRQLARTPGLPPAARRAHVITEKRATFLCTPGLARPSQHTPLRGFHVAGDYTASDYPATLEAAVRSGLACARAILENP